MKRLRNNTKFLRDWSKGDVVEDKSPLLPKTRVRWWKTVWKCVRKRLFRRYRRYRPSPRRLKKISQTHFRWNNSKQKKQKTKKNT